MPKITSVSLHSCCCCCCCCVSISKSCISLIFFVKCLEYFICVLYAVLNSVYIVVLHHTHDRRQRTSFASHFETNCISLCSHLSYICIVCVLSHTWEQLRNDFLQHHAERVCIINAHRVCCGECGGWDLISFGKCRRAA